MGMKFATLFALLSIILFAGCAQRYRVTLTNGNTITAHNKPRLNAERSAFVFKDRNGQQMVVPTGKVREIAPADEPPESARF